MLSLIAEAIEPISGFSGWFGATALGGVLSWLLFVYLPSKDRQLKEFIENKDKQINIMAEYYRADLRLVAEHCQSEMREFGDRFKAELGLLRESMVTSIRELLAQQRER